MSQAIIFAFLLTLLHLSYVNTNFGLRILLAQERPFLCVDQELCLRALGSEGQHLARLTRD